MTPRHRIDSPSGHPTSTVPSHPEAVELDDALEARLAQFGEPPPWAARAGRRTFREKFAAGLRGLKHAFRGDSSFFAHAYRGILIALTAALMRVGPLQWCLLATAGTLVMIAELAHGAVVTLARASDDSDEPASIAACEIATAGVLVASVTFVGVAVTVLTLRFLETLGM